MNVDKLKLLEERVRYLERTRNVFIKRDEFKALEKMEDYIVDLISKIQDLVDKGEYTYQEINKPVIILRSQLLKYFEHIDKRIKYD